MGYQAPGRALLKIIGIDPGSEETAFALMDGKYTVLEAAKVPNDEFLDCVLPGMLDGGKELAVESIQSYGMAVGKSVFETCYVIGQIQRIAKLNGTACYLYPRPEYARALVGGMKVKDSMVRQALMTRFGGDKKGEPLHLLKGNSDKRSAFAIAVYHADKRRFAAQTE